MTTSAGSGYNDNVKCLRKKVVRMQYRHETALSGIKTGGCSRKFQMRRFLLRSDPLLTFTTVEKVSFSYTLHKIFVPLVSLFLIPNRQITILKKIRSLKKFRVMGGASPFESFQGIPHSPLQDRSESFGCFKNKCYRLAFILGPRCEGILLFVSQVVDIQPHLLINLQYIGRIRRMASEGKQSVYQFTVLIGQVTGNKRECIYSPLQLRVRSRSELKKYLSLGNE